MNRGLMLYVKHTSRERRITSRNSLGGYIKALGGMAGKEEEIAE
jgi:hypothetical protein